jgi:hypothetical protein
MTFAVTLKGIRRCSGRLSTVYRYIEETWGSRALAWEAGVKLEPIVGR